MIGRFRPVGLTFARCAKRDHALFDGTLDGFFGVQDVFLDKLERAGPGNERKDEKGLINKFREKQKVNVNIYWHFQMSKNLQFFICINDCIYKVITQLDN